MKLGLVLSGGGGKGSYEIGVWKAFSEYGIKFNVIAGTSIGAINGLLMTIMDVNKAENLWLNLEQGITSYLSEEDITQLKMNNKINQENIVLMRSAFENPTRVKDLAKRQGLISQKPLFDMLDNMITENNVKSSDKTFYACSVLAEQNPKAEYFKVNDYSKEDIKSIVVSSTALPVIFDAVTVQGKKYFDGGILDVSPIKPVYEEGCDLIFVIYLHQDATINFGQYSDVPIIPIVPSKHLGDFKNGTMDISKQGAIDRIKLGYEDTKRLIDGLNQLNILTNK